MTQDQIVHLIHGEPAGIHLLGVSGSGMSGIAALLLALGHRVSGSDRSETEEIQRLKKKGLVFFGAHAAEHVEGVSAVVYSSAIRPENPAFQEASRRGIPLLRRASALAAILSGKKGILVAGMHGKTTTSSMAAFCLGAAELRPSHYVGAEIPILGTNARWDSDGEWFVAEGDESDGTLVEYRPEISIILNVEPEHLDFYKDLAQIDEVFARLVAATKRSVIFCADDAGAARVSKGAAQRISYGESEEADFRLTGMRVVDGRPCFRIREHGEDLGEVRLGIPGRHNAKNAGAVLALGRSLGVSFASLAGSLEKFEGARRRFEKIYRDEEFWVVDDYGHHPTEIAATLDTARLTGMSRTVVMFQPHRYSRTQALRREFGPAFRESELLAVTEIYAASESPLDGISGETVVQSARDAGHASAFYEKELRLLPRRVGALLRPGDLVLSLGAGNIHEAGKAVAADLALRRKVLEVAGPCSVKLHEPLSKHTTMRVGGPARIWVEPETERGFADLVRFCTDSEIPLLVVGRGSNLLVRDGGIPGVVVHLSKGEFARHQVEGCEITAGVGVRFKQLSAIAKNEGLTGFEWMEGIPGNLGGGLRMNAGAMGWQTFDQVVRVRFCDEDGNIFHRTPEELVVRYRDVPSMAKNYALSATLRGTPANREEIDLRMEQSMLKRKSSQPVGSSAGCIFKNPEELPAGRLIEELGLKGMRSGGARVSEIHGNFIVNDGGATSADVLALIEAIRKEAREKRGIDLKTEVQILGEDL